MRSLAHTVLIAAIGLTACMAESDREPVVLGPADGRELPGIDLERVQAGDVAPDFSLASLAGPAVTLSDFRVEKNVILVFYRGYW